MADNQASENQESTPNQKQVQFEPQGGFSGWLANVFTPGIGFGVINFTRVCLVAMMVFLVYMVIFSYNIHWLIMSILGICLTLSFEFFISELKKNPEVMDPANKKEEEPKEAETKEKTD